MIDLLLTASCYKSADSAIRLLKSINYIEGNCLTIITSPRMDDLRKIEQSKEKNVLLFLSKFDNMYACRNWGFIWAYTNGIIPRFYCSIDDDIEFIPDSRDIVARLDRDDYAVMTFNNEAQWYRGTKIGNIATNLAWINGDSMFTHYEDNIKYGLPDCLPQGASMPYFVETEYQHRLSIMLNKPIIADTEKVFYKHHHRDDPKKLALRSENGHIKMSSGLKFLVAKYNTTITYGINDTKFWPSFRDVMIEKGPVIEHMLYGIGADYPAIYNKIEGDYTQIYSEDECTLSI